VPDHHSVEAAIAWVDAAAQCLGTEHVPLHTARGRVLTEPMRALESIPRSDRAALDGFAVQASASLGAGAYNPVRLPSIALAAGDALPAGTDAIVPLELAEPDGQGWIDMIDAVAAGDNVEQQGAIATIGATLVPAGTRLAARHIGLLTIAGLSQVPVVRRPCVRILVAKRAKESAWADSNEPMIRAAVKRDGGVVGECVAVERDLMAIRAGLLQAGVDILLVIGGSGPGCNDHSATALAEAGELPPNPSCSREIQAQVGLAGGARRIRTLGPSRKGSAGKVEHLVGPFSGGTEGSNPSSSSGESVTNRAAAREGSGTGSGCG